MLAARLPSASRPCRALPLSRAQPTPKTRKASRQGRAMQARAMAGPEVEAVAAGVQTLALTSAVSTDLSGYFVPFVVGWGAIIALFVPIITLSLNPIDIIAKFTGGEE